MIVKNQLENLIIALEICFISDTIKPIFLKNCLSRNKHDRRIV